MADEEAAAVSRPVKTKNKKKGLPPISPRDEDDTGEAIRPVRRKKKKPAQPTESSNDVANEEEKPAPRRRRKRSPSQTKSAEDQAPAADSTTVPKKKKKKPKPSPEEGEDQNQSAEPLQSQRESQGSKTSLLSKDATPTGKKGGKKKKKVRKTPQGEEYDENRWEEELRTLEEDIITGDREDGDGEEEEEVEGGGKKMTTFVTAPILRSQPLNKIFIETSTKFKGQDKKALTKQQVEKTMTEEVIKETPKMTTADFAIGTNNVFRVITLFLHGLTAGLALWQLAIVYVLASFPNDDFFEHYYRIAMPLQGSLYFLLVICAVSACDRFDISRPSRRFILRALTLQNGAISVVFCLAAVVLNVVTIRYEDRLSLYKDYTDLYTDDNAVVDSQVTRTSTQIPVFMRSSEIDSFRSLNTARSVFAILSWLVISITPNTDRLGMSLKSGKTGLEMELDQISSA